MIKTSRWVGNRTRRGKSRGEGGAQKTGNTWRRKEEATHTTDRRVENLHGSTPPNTGTPQGSHGENDERLKRRRSGCLNRFEENQAA